MGTQFIFVVEADRKCKSDWVYIKDTMDHFYQYDSSNIKLSPVYMAGRENYKKKEREAAFVWFCKDVEQVYIGRSIEDSQKKKMAAAFKEREQIREIRSRQLSAEVYRNHMSNILRVLDSYSELRRKQ